MSMSNLDRALRSLLVAPAAIAAGVLTTADSTGAIVLFALAAIMLATSAVGFCPLYTLLRIDTRGGTPLPH